MKTALVLALALVIVALLFPEDSEARQVSRLRARGQRRVAAFQRRGRTAQSNDYPEPPAPPAGDEAAADGDDVPEWCNYAMPMGAWLNFGNIRSICGERGFSDFGPYGGVPAEEGGDDMAADA